MGLRRGPDDTGDDEHGSVLATADGSNDGSGLGRTDYGRRTSVGGWSVGSYVSMASAGQGFSGPMAESVPTSLSSNIALGGRRRSYSFHSDGDDDDDVEGEGDHDNGTHDDDDYDSEEQRHKPVPGHGGTEQADDMAGVADGGTGYGPSLFDAAGSLEMGPAGRPRRSGSMGSRSSISGSGVRRRRSSSRASSRAGSIGAGRGRTSQKIDLAAEGLQLVIAGYETSTFGTAAYWALAVLTAGLACLVLRWLPHRRIRLVGRRADLADARWVVVETQWGDVDVVDVDELAYPAENARLFGFPAGVRRQWCMTDDNPDGEVLPMVEYRYMRFCYSRSRDRFVQVGSTSDPAWKSIEEIDVGLAIPDREIRAAVFGPNMIDIREKKASVLLVDEILHPFYIFQLASIVLWSLDEYYYYATCIFLISAGSIAATLVDTRATMRRLRTVARFECPVWLKAATFWKRVESSQLVPGDVFQLSGGAVKKVPCDCLLLSGDCIVNESMLTGESMPVSKTPASDHTLANLKLDVPTMEPDVASHVLFSGTEIVRIQGSHAQFGDPAAKGGVATALVLRTGFDTTKGALVRSMVFPRPSGFKFYQDSFRYISVMAGIALVGFAVSVVNFLKLGLPVQTIIIRALDLITIVVPPALPATLTIGTSFAISRLNKKGIFCISPSKVNVGGKLDIVCFDKTGTLTEDGLKVLGVRCRAGRTNRLGDRIEQADGLVGRSGRADADDCEATMIRAMATCHSLKRVDGELIGDPLDLVMFEFTHWLFHDGSTEEQDGGSPDGAGQVLENFPLGFGKQQAVSRPPGSDMDSDLAVIRSFEFVSHLRRASVIVRHPDGSAVVYVKGAPESLRDICTAASIPDDFDQQLHESTGQGLRVIAVASRQIRDTSWFQLNRIGREEAEAELDFIGFIEFDNPLKPQSRQTIDELTAANIRTVMCTGDNILTAISVARKVGMVGPNLAVFSPRFVTGDADFSMSEIEWTDVTDPTSRLDPHTLERVDQAGSAGQTDYGLAVPGDVFRWLIRFAATTTVQAMAVRACVFARMSPDEKHELVTQLQEIDYTCGFCGDGANDCGALKAADVGISLSVAEASVAAPFTSRNFDVSCVPTLIKEGRAALVTSFSCFKYMSLYSAIQFTTVSFLYASAANLGDFQYLFIDLFLILPIAVVMAWSGPFEKLGRKRPTASLVSFKVLVALLGQIALMAAIQTIAFVVVRRQSWYIPPVISDDESNSLNSDNTALFLVSCFEYVFSAIVLSVGPPFRAPVMENKPFMVTLAITTAMSVGLLFVKSGPVFELMELTNTSGSFRWFIIAITAVGLGISLLFERVWMPRLASWMKSTSARGICPKSSLSSMIAWWKKTRRQSGSTYDYSPVSQTGPGLDGPARRPSISASTLDRDRGRSLRSRKMYKRLLEG